MKKHDAGQFGERHTLEQLVVCGLTLLEQILESSPSLVEALLNKVSAVHFFFVSSFLPFVLQTVNTGRGESSYLVLMIAQYVHYPHANKVPLLAVRVLTRLCQINASEGKGKQKVDIFSFVFSLKINYLKVLLPSWAIWETLHRTFDTLCWSC
jgi:hypothetical protein